MKPKQQKGDNKLQAESRQIGLVAAEWLVKRDRGLTATEQDEFFQWLAGDPRHGEWFARHQETWKDFNLLVQWKPEHSAEPNPDLLAQSVPARRSQVVGFGILAAAASIALAALFVWSPWKQGTEPVAGNPPANVAQSYERRVLEDGSIVELNRGARIEVGYTVAERRVKLTQGEANFTVAKNTKRPFIVHAGGVAVRAIGTVFNVRLDDKSVEVLVSEGQVQVSPPVSSTSAPVVEMPLLLRGDRARVPLTPEIPPEIAQVSPEEMTRLLSWQPQLLDFTSTPLADVVAEFNRRNQVQLMVGDADLNSVPIVASFRSDNVEGFVRLLELTAGVKAERSGNTITLRKKQAILP